MDQVQLTRVCKAYGSQRVLDNVDFCANRGEFVVVIGRSGSGKSTLLNLIGGLDEPDSGSVAIGDTRLDRISEAERALFRRTRIGFVFQFFNLIPTLTVAENIELPLALNGLARPAIADRVGALLDELGIGESARRFPEELSGGEQQRVAIARAVAHEPDIVLADEPTGNLDLETAERVLHLLNETCRRRGATLLMATHGREVVGLADRVVTIRHGRIEAATW
ncbi:MAG: ABC transporter ATP-binding protein [Gammaproteobacteria bacterium]|nr:ABC transporter ATP-binding protein [Gammaproteobacteria bacterium]